MSSLLPLQMCGQMAVKEQAMSCVFQEYTRIALTSFKECTHMEKSTDTKVAVCKFLDFIPRYVP